MTSSATRRAGGAASPRSSVELATKVAPSTLAFPRPPVLPARIRGQGGDLLRLLLWAGSYSSASHSAVRILPRSEETGQNAAMWADNETTVDLLGFDHLGPRVVSLGGRSIGQDAPSPPGPRSCVRPRSIPMVASVPRSGAWRPPPSSGRSGRAFCRSGGHPHGTQSDGEGVAHVDGRRERAGSLFDRHDGPQSRVEHPGVAEADRDAREVA